MIRLRYIAAASFLFTLLFFIEYTPIFRGIRKVHIPFDLEGFHYPLADYAFQALHQGRFPEWDPAIYGGLSFAGNVQAALFYPPMWLLFVANWGRTRLTYQGLEYLDLAHVWLAFLLGYLWLHRKRLHPLACALGGGVFAFSGYMLLQLQHFGLIAGYAWMPLGFAGIDTAVEENSWRPLWKVAAASAMCFLAGYPSTWVAFCIVMIAYATGRTWKGAAQVAAALALSLLLAAVQALPAWEASRMKTPEPKYGVFSGTKDPVFFISYFVPNYFDFGLEVPAQTNPGREYLYLGAAGLAGLTLLLLGRRCAGAGPAIAVLATSLLFLTNPFGALGWFIERSSFLTQIFSSYYFLAGLTAAVALLAALGLDYGLKRPGKPAPRWLALAAVALSLCWSMRLLLDWAATKSELAVGWRSGVDALIGTASCLLLIVLFPRSSRLLRGATAASLLILAGADYKAFGTSKRFNASRGRFSADPSKPHPGFNASVLETLRQRLEFRTGLDATGPFPLELRQMGLITPQGFDPFLPEQYRILIERVGRFRTNREFDLNLDDTQTLRLLGVRYFICSENSEVYPQLRSSPNFHPLQPDDSYFKVFELDEPSPAFGWEELDPDHSVELVAWRPERRAFVLGSTAGGRFRLSEQSYPGWKASVDGAEAPVDRCHQSFQCVAIPGGRHTLEFRYHSRWLFLGGAITLCSMLLTCLLSQRNKV